MLEIQDPRGKNGMEIGGSHFEWWVSSKFRLRVRHSLARYAANHGFPFAGDGMVILKGQAPTRGWLGSRWKQRLRQQAPS